MFLKLLHLFLQLFCVLLSLLELLFGVIQFVLGRLNFVLRFNQLFLNALRVGLAVLKLLLQSGAFLSLLLCRSSLLIELLLKVGLFLLVQVFFVF